MPMHTHLIMNKVGNTFKLHLRFHAYGSYVTTDKWLKTTTCCRKSCYSLSFGRCMSSKLLFPSSDKLVSSSTVNEHSLLSQYIMQRLSKVEMHATAYCKYQQKLHCGLIAFVSGHHVKRLANSTSINDNRI